LQRWGGEGRIRFPFGEGEALLRRRGKTIPVLRLRRPARKEGKSTNPAGKNHYLYHNNFTFGKGKEEKNARPRGGREKEKKRFFFRRDSNSCDTGRGKGRKEVGDAPQIEKGGGGRIK